MNIRKTIKLVMKKVLCRIAYFSGLYLLLDKIFSKKGVYIIMYHRLAEADRETGELPFLAVDRHDAERQIRYFTRRYEILPVSEAVKKLKENTKLRKNYMAITFDDGYKDNYSYGNAIFHKSGISPTIYVTGDYINQAAEDGLPKESELMLSWDEINRLAEEGVEIGAHTMTHPALDRLSLTDVASELVCSKELIEQKTGRLVKSFSYPYGIYNDEVRAETSRYFESAVTTDTGVNYPGADLYRLKRIGIEPGISLAHLKLRLLRIGIRSRYT